MTMKMWLGLMSAIAVGMLIADIAGTELAILVGRMII